MEEVRKKVLSRIKPSKKEEENVHNFTHKVLDILQDLGYESPVVGSIGKNTWLSGDHDIDIFVLFPKETTREDLERKGLEIGSIVAKKVKGKPIKKYAEHPYTQIKIKNFKIDIVPCYRIEKGEKIISAVDRSPLHLRYVLENLKPEQKDDVRLLKQFLKGLNLYGSDVKHLGFSGYVCELLIIIYGSFQNLLKDAASWKIPQVLNMDKEVMKSKNLQGALFLADPVDPERNAAAALNSENLIKFISASKQFLEKPAVETFFAKTTPLSSSQISKLKKRKTYFLALLSKRPDIINDTLFPQLRKSLDRLHTLLKHEDFNVLNTTEYADNNSILILFEFQQSTLPEIKQMIGPPIYADFHSSQFLSKYNNPEFGPFVLDNNWLVEVKRKHKTPESVLKSFFSQQEKDLVNHGIPENLVKSLRSSEILKEAQLWSLIKRNKSLSDFLRRRYFYNIKI